MKTVTFCGHSEIYNSEPIESWLYKVTENLIQEGADTFLLGGYGRFDGMAAKTVWNLKKQYPGVTSILVLPYLDKKVDNYGLSYDYDDTTYPPLENVPRRFAILKRNEWMVRESDVIVAYVTHGWGGAAKTLEYAERKKKRIIRYNAGAGGEKE